MAAIKIVQVGLGPLGQRITRYLSERSEGLEIIGAVDVDRKKIGQDLGGICGIQGKLSIPVMENIEQVLRQAKPEVALLTTVSDMERITPQIKAIVAHGIHVVSTCEELSFPWTTFPLLAKQIDEAAKQKQAAVLGTGVNPGFLMDFFPTTLTALCQRLDRIMVSRIQNAAFRREPFQKKIGAGLTTEQFEAKRKEGTLGHVGLTESIYMIAGRVGWKLDKTENTITPVLAQEEISTKKLTIRPGMASGVQQVGRGLVNGEEKITLLFRASVGEPNPRDTTEIFGEPDIVSSIPGGVNGDVATCALTINAAKQILRAPPGLQTMLDIPVVSYFSM